MLRLTTVQTIELESLAAPHCQSDLTCIPEEILGSDRSIPEEEERNCDPSSSCSTQSKLVSKRPRAEAHKAPC